jgi:hypothetical protein
MHEGRISTSWQTHLLLFVATLLGNTLLAKCVHMHMFEACKRDMHSSKQRMNQEGGSEFEIGVFMENHTCGEPSSFAMATVLEIQYERAQRSRWSKTTQTPNANSAQLARNKRGDSLLGRVEGSMDISRSTMRHGCFALPSLWVMVAFLVTFPPVAVPDRTTTHAKTRPCIKTSAQAPDMGKNIHARCMCGMDASSKVSLDQEESCSMMSLPITRRRQEGDSPRRVACIITCPPWINAGRFRLDRLRGGRGSESSDEEDDGGYQDAAAGSEEEGGEGPSSQDEAPEGWGGVEGGDFRIWNLEYMSIAAMRGPRF